MISRATGRGALDQYVLGTYPNGSTLYLGESTDAGYPAELYPNLTYHNNSTVSYKGLTLNNTSSLLLGPLFMPENNVTLISMTVAINNNTSRVDVLGWLTMVLDARTFIGVVDSRVGLGSSGEVLVIGPARMDNSFDIPVAGQPESTIENLEVQFELPPSVARHGIRNTDPYESFPMKQYPAVVKAWSADSNEINNAGVVWSTHDESNNSLSVGYATVDSPMVDWVVVFAQTQSEVNRPLYHLRDTVLACLFSVVGAVIIISLLVAHHAVKPIRALQRATENSVTTYETYMPPSVNSDSGTEKSLLNWNIKDGEKGQANPLSRKRSRPKKIRTFQIPEKVPVTKHLVEDELTDLTAKFNDMSEELVVQYAKLEDRVKERTAQLEKSRNEAHAANESKTLFIANVSHELRTPLNGIIGMCAVAMQEDNVKRIRQSLNIIYKSSDLLLHLLNDLLTFSRSSYGQQLSIEDGTFRLVDIGCQLISIFEKQAKDADIGLKVVFLGPNSSYPNSDDEPEDAIIARRDIAGSLSRVKTTSLAIGPADVGPLREVGLRGDKNRILQVLMNLVSNSLKFTPSKGLVEVRIRCRGFCDMAPPMDDVSNATTATGPVDGSSVDVPTIRVRKASEIPGQASHTESVVKGLVFSFEVEDTGAGIPENLQKEIFKPFVQGDLSLSKKHGGTGLGLSICEKLAELMGGAVQLKSTPDIGSTFTLTLPLRYTKEIVPSVSGSLAQSGRNGSVCSSIQIENFSARSTRSRQASRTQPHSKRTSLVSENQEEYSSTELKKPQLVGFTQPFIVDNDELHRPKSPRRPAKYDKTPSSRNRLEAITSVEHQSPTTPGLSSFNMDARSPETETPGEGSILGSPTPISPSMMMTATPDPIDSDATGPDTTDPNSKSAARSPTVATPTTPSKQPKATPPPANAASTQSIEGPAVRILVAEDNAVNQQVILRLLKLEKVPDADVTLAEDGQLALDAVQKSLDPAAGERPYKLVFMDIQMPRMDGIEATQKIRELGFEAPIVALTAFDHETNRKNCDEAGMNAFLGKPIKRTALRKVLAEYKPNVGASTDGKAVPGVETTKKADHVKDDDKAIKSEGKAKEVRA